MVEWCSTSRTGNKAECWSRRLAASGYQSLIESIRINGPQIDRGIDLSYPFLVDILGEDFVREFDEAPEQAISLLGLALRHLASYDTCIGKITARISNYPVTLHFKDLKACNIGKFITVRGTAVRVGPIKPLAYQMAFLCTKCQQVIIFPMPDGLFKQPARCRTYNCPGKQFVPDRSSPETLCRNFQKIKVQEILNDDGSDCGRIPRTLECELLDDLVNSVAPGENVTLSGILAVSDSEEVKAKSNPLYSLILLCNSIISEKSQTFMPQGTSVDENQRVLLFSADEISTIRAISREKNVFRMLTDSLCPEIFGHEIVKAGLLLGLFRGREDSHGATGSFSIRSNSHILLVGDPGLGKSQMLTAVSTTAPRSVFVGANTSTAAGLTATLHQEGGPGEYALEAGALVLADQGCCCIDEFDKISEYKVLLDVMEQQVVNVAKAGVVCSLPARTSIMAAANPVGGHYNHNKPLSQNIKLDGALLSRFDLIFILLDKPDAEIDRYLSERILDKIARNDQSCISNRQLKKIDTAKSLAAQVNQEMQDEEECNFLNLLVDKTRRSETLIPVGMLRKYIAYAQKYVFPRLSDEASAVLKSFYLEVRKVPVNDDFLPVTTRQLESAIRLSEARAKAELRNVVTKTDAEDVVAIMRYCMFECHRSGNPGSRPPAKSGRPKSKAAMIKEYIEELMRISGRTGESLFSTEQLQQLFQALFSSQTTSVTFTELMEALNHHGYVLRKPGGQYKLLAV